MPFNCEHCGVYVNWELEQLGDVPNPATRDPYLCLNCALHHQYNKRDDNNDLNH